MMKTKFYKIQAMVLLVSISLLTSCNDFFDVAPQNSLQEEDYYRNGEDLNAGGLGIYAALTPEVHKFLLWGSARADLVEAGQQGADAYVTEFVNNKVSALNPYTNYSGLYKAIARCNRQLEHIDGVRKLDKSLSTIEAGAFYAEAYYMRALCYFYLVRTYKEFPIITQDLSENVTFVKENGDTVKINTLELSSEDLRAVALKPASEQAVWKLILSDMQKAMGLMPATPKWNGQTLSNEERYGRASLAGTYALATEVSLWMGEYLKATAYSDLVTKNPNYSIGASTAWGNQYINSYASGPSLFLLGYEFSKSHETNRLQEFTSNVSADGGRYLLKPVKNTVDKLFSVSADCRIPYSYKRINRIDLIWKYIGASSDEAMRAPYRSVASWHILKTPDVFLMKALAENRLKNTRVALDFLNQVRTNRNLEKYEYAKMPSLEMEYIEDLILDEKARESAFEGKRWYDLLLVSKVFGRTDLLPEKVSQKYPKDKQAEMFQYLQNQENWYIPIEPDRWK